MARLISEQRSIDRSTMALKKLRFLSPKEGWIRKIRLAMGMSQADLARKLGVKQRSLHQLEISESLKTIRLSSLEKVANALDCELVYAFVPRGSLESNYEMQARRMAQRQIVSIEQNMRLEEQEHKMSKENLEEIKRELIRRNAVRWEIDA